MKILLAAIVLLSFTGCLSSQETQAELSNAELIRVDTVFRYDRDLLWQKEQVLTWKDNDNNTFVTYADIDQSDLVGTKIAVLRRR